MTAGFTLLELLVVLAVMALVLAAAPAVISSVIPGQKVRAVVKELAADLRGARMTSIASRREVAVQLDVSGQRYAIGGDKRLRVIPNEARLSLARIPRSEVEGTKGRIRFFPDGTSTGGRVDVLYGDRRYAVTVNWLTGQVSIND